jgi:site-specific DNA-methyltransferase (adenine-specific)
MDNKTYNIDCLEYMRSLDDKVFDLAIVDPPYGLPKSSTHGRGKLKDRILNADSIHEWDIVPRKEYFDQLFRVSKNQIIWGGNYFDLPPTRCVVCWDKMQPWENFSQIELAWTSFDKPASLFRFDNRTKDKIHPTQKPVELYAWLMRKFASEGDRILDTHLGSGSSRIASYKLGFDFVGCEINQRYYEAQEERFRKECLGQITTSKGTYTQQSLFF